jgi:hypothetical protein
VATVYTVIGQHRTLPGLFLLLGDDNRYYGHAPGKRPSPVEPTADWVLDTDRDRGADAVSVALVPVSAAPLAHHAASRPGFWHDLAASVSLARRPLRTIAIAVAFILAAVLGGTTALAHAPAMVTASSDVPLLAAPSDDASVLAVLPAGSEVELTGEADGDYLEISSEGQTGWAGVDSFDRWLDTASVTADATLLAAPTADGEVLGAVQAGSTVILTGASVDGFLAASFDGSGGWLPASAVA